MDIYIVRHVGYLPNGFVAVYVAVDYDCLDRARIRFDGLCKGSLLAHEAVELLHVKAERNVAGELNFLEPVLLASHGHFGWDGDRDPMLELI